MPIKIDDHLQTKEGAANVSAEIQFVAQQSDIKAGRYVFIYTITIKNLSAQPFQLISRRWIIHHANHKVEEVFGEGVIGEQPVIEPGNSYTYSSGAILETEVGTMQGRYYMRGSDGSEFAVNIPRFVLSIPRTVH